MRVWLRRSAATWIVGAIALIGVVAWALRPMSDPRANMRAFEAPSAQAVVVAGVDAPWDRAAFQATLITAPKPEPEVTEAPPPQPQRPPARSSAPFKMQLVAILCDDDAEPIEAVLYDPASDRLVTAAPGERLGAFTLASIGPTGITVVPADSPGAREQRLALRESNPRGGS